MNRAEMRRLFMFFECGNHKF